MLSYRLFIVVYTSIVLQMSAGLGAILDISMIMPINKVSLVTHLSHYCQQHLQD